MRYELRLATTSSGIGYFASIPVEQASLDEKLAYLRSCPLDDFMHRHVLEMMQQLDLETARKFLTMARDRDELMLTLLYEASLSFRHLEALQASFSEDEARSLLKWSPLIDIKAALLADQQAHRQWIQLFDRNISQLHPLPSMDRVQSGSLPTLFGGEELAALFRNAIPVGSLHPHSSSVESEPREALPSAQETARRALDGLQAVGALMGEEVIHHSSLSPHGFLRKWRLNISVRNGRHQYTLTGTQTSYGKGLSVDSARASYAMEIVERYSSFASVGPQSLPGFQEPYRLEHGTYEEILGSGQHVLDPNRLRLEAPYANEPLYWIEARQLREGGLCSILIPVQTIFLFCNLDEVNLFSGLGSTGLASGNTLEQAKVSALLEVIERDCEGTMPHHRSRCFTLTADDPETASLLDDYNAKGIQLQFEDLTHELGVPCIKCMVMGPRGGIVKGTAAHLDGRKALLSALTETPYPYPQGPPSGPGLSGLPTRRFEDLPVYATGQPSQDLSTLESLLTANGYHPIYVDLTREDLRIPVVKAIVPGMELSADFDRFSRVSPRLFSNYLSDLSR